MLNNIDLLNHPFQDFSLEELYVLCDMKNIKFLLVRYSGHNSLYNYCSKDTYLKDIQMASIYINRFKEFINSQSIGMLTVRRISKEEGEYFGIEIVSNDYLSTFLTWLYLPRRDWGALICH